MVTFTTHEYLPDSLDERDKYSEVYTYKMGDASATSIYNDTSAQELQPVFVIIPASITVYPFLHPSVASLTFGTTDTGKTSAAQSVNIGDTSTIASALIDSIVFQGGDGEFSITNPPVPGTTIANGSHITLQVVFSPKAPGSIKYDTIVVYSSTSSNPIVRIPVSGTANIPPPPPPQSVTEEDPAIFQMTTLPNPFASSTRIDLVAPESGMMGIVVHDALGHQVYSSGLKMTAAGQAQSFTFDASALGLSAGAYYVTAISPNHSASREVVFVK
jgi:hypothetical protein